jgi:hypothetical protein
VPQGQPGAGGPTLIHTDAIVVALKQAGVTPSHGLADGNYETAAHAFQNKGYAVSIPGFRKALEAYPGLFLADRNLKTALQMTQAGQGGPTVGPALTNTAPLSGTGSSTRVRWWWWLLIAAAALLAAAAVVWLSRRRKRRSPPPGGAPSGGKVPPGSSSGPAGPGAAVAPSGGRAPPPASRTSASPAATSRPIRGAAPVRGESTVLSDPALPRQPVHAAGRASVVKAPVFCTNCGGRLAPHHHFCGWCGDPVAEPRVRR